MSMQVEVIEMFLISASRFAALTVNEILHAFYLNNQGQYEQVYRHYNKELNGEFIGDVLLAYLRYKDSIYARANIKALIEAPAEKKKTIVIPDAACLEYIQQDYNLYKMGAVDFIYCALPKYNLLRKLDFIRILSRDHWNHYYLWAMKQRIRYGDSSAEPFDKHGRDDRAAVREMYENANKGGLPITEHRVLISMIRKRHYLELFKDLTSLNIQNILTDLKIDILSNVGK